MLAHPLDEPPSRNGSFELSEAVKTVSPGGSILSGIRIIDMTTVMMGPYATLQLAELGADVVKVESPAGDSMRAVGPMKNPGMGPLYLHANRNKRSVVIDLKQETGKAVVRRLIAKADVFVSNVRSSALARLGLDYPSLAKLNPSLVYAVANGFGSGGAYDGRPAYDDLIQGLAGVPHMAAKAYGDGVPRYAPVVLADRVTGLALANAILAALVNRAATGRGHHVEVPMFETVTHMVMGDHLGGLTFHPHVGAWGYQRLLVEHRRPYKTSDGHIGAVIYTDAHWREFLRLVDCPEMFRNDPRFSDLGTRTRHIGELYAFAAEKLASRPTAEWLKLLAEADIPAAPIHSPHSILEDPHLESVGFFQVAEHPTEGPIMQMRRPSRWLGDDGAESTLAPRLGEHTRSVLSEADYSDEEIAALLRDCAVVQAGAASDAENDLRS